MFVHRLELGDVEILLLDIKLGTVLLADQSGGFFLNSQIDNPGQLFTPDLLPCHVQEVRNILHRSLQSSELNLNVLELFLK